MSDVDWVIVVTKWVLAELRRGTSGSASSIRVTTTRSHSDRGFSLATQVAIHAYVHVHAYLM